MTQEGIQLMNRMLNPTSVLIYLLAGFSVCALSACAQESKPAGKPNFPETLPGRGLAQHDFLYAGEAKTRDIYIVRGGQVVWEYHDPTGRGEISDAVRLSDGNILFAHQFGIELINPEKQVLWHYEAPAGCETHTAQPIGTNRVIFIQNGLEPKIMVANLATGRMERELPLPVGNPKSTHGQTRHARLTEAGTYLVAHMDLRKVVEYDETGKAVWTASVPGAWSAVRLQNGNTLVCGKGAQEINPQGQTVWEFTSADVPDFKFNSWQIATRLANGNTLMNQWVNSWSEKIDAETAPVQALEVTPDSRVSSRLPIQHRQGIVRRFRDLPRRHLRAAAAVAVAATAVTTQIPRRIIEFLKPNDLPKDNLVDEPKPPFMVAPTPVAGIGCRANAWNFDPACARVGCG